MAEPGRSEELTMDEAMVKWLADSGRRERMIYLVVLIGGVCLLITGGLLGAVVTAVRWVISRDAPAIGFELVMTVSLVVGLVWVWRRMREKHAQIDRDLRERVFLRTTGQVQLALRNNGGDGAVFYELQVPGRTLTLYGRDGARLQEILRKQPDVSSTGSWVNAALTMAHATVDYTKHAGVFLALRDSGGGLVYRINQ